MKSNLDFSKILVIWSIFCSTLINCDGDFTENGQLIFAHVVSEI